MEAGGMSDDTFRDGMRYSFKDNGGPVHPGVNKVINETGRPEWMYIPAEGLMPPGGSPTHPAP